MHPNESWERLACTEPYYAVLTNLAFLGAADSPDLVRQFFATGEADVAWLLELAARVDQQSLRTVSALDFGCGVGRLTLALTGRFEHVVGVDVSPTMIELADRHREMARIANAEFVTVQQARATPELFDFICSLIVFQHIPAPVGYELIEWLLRKTKPGGIAALHVVCSRPGGWFRRVARRLRSRVYVVHRAIQTIRREAIRLPYMEVNAYDLRKVLDLYERCGFGKALLESTDHADVRGVVVIARRES